MTEDLCEIDHLASEEDFLIFHTFLNSVYNSFNRSLKDYGILEVETDKNVLNELHFEIDCSHVSKY